MWKKEKLFISRHLLLFFLLVFPFGLFFTGSTKITKKNSEVIFGSFFLYFSGFKRHQFTIGFEWNGVMWLNKWIRVLHPELHFKEPNGKKRKKSKRSCWVFSLLEKITLVLILFGFLVFWRGKKREVCKSKKRVLFSFFSLSSVFPFEVFSSSWSSQEKKQNDPVFRKDKKQSRWFRFGMSKPTKFWLNHLMICGNGKKTEKKAIIRKQEVRIHQKRGSKKREPFLLLNFGLNVSVHCFFIGLLFFDFFWRLWCFLISR